MRVSCVFPRVDSWLRGSLHRPSMLMLANYKIDPAHSSAQFSVRHMMISNVRGAFGSVQGTVAYDSQNVARTGGDLNFVEFAQVRCTAGTSLTRDRKLARRLP